MTTSIASGIPDHVLNAAIREPVNHEQLNIDRLAKARAAMDLFGLDALVLFRPENATYVTGMRKSELIPSVSFYFPSVAVLVKGDDPYLFTTDADGVPTSMRDSHVGEPFFVELEPEAVALAHRVRDVLGSVTGKRIGLDLMNPSVWRVFPRELAGAELVDGQEVMLHARRTKTLDELRCLMVCETATEAAMSAVIPAIRPGVTGIELNGIFLKRLTELGILWTIMEGVFCPTPTSLGDVPAAAKTPYRKLTNSEPFAHGDLIAIDVGAVFKSYAADFGRTWWCGFQTTPSAQQKDLYKEWVDVSSAMLELVRPGTTAADIHRAAGTHITSYVAHGLGLGVEPPMVGGHAQRIDDEEKEVLEPGMVMVIEPYIWRDGVGGFRAEEGVIITENGHLRITNFPHGPLSE